MLDVIHSYYLVKSKRSHYVVMDVADINYSQCSLKFYLSILLFIWCWNVLNMVIIVSCSQTVPLGWRFGGQNLGEKLIEKKLLQQQKYFIKNDLKVLKSNSDVI